jgi:hypothetical protein
MHPPKSNDGEEDLEALVRGTCSRTGLVGSRGRRHSAAEEAQCVGDGQIFQEDEGKACVRWRNLERTNANNFFLKKKKEKRKKKENDDVGSFK